MNNGTHVNNGFKLVIVIHKMAVMIKIMMSTKTLLVIDDRDNNNDSNVSYFCSSTD